MLLYELMNQVFLMPESVKTFFCQTGSVGGKKRAALYSKAQIREWGKLGGRPRKDDAKRKHGSSKGAN
jgi:hypothetical protein